MENKKPKMHTSKALEEFSELSTEEGRRAVEAEMLNKELPQEVMEDLKEHYSAGIVPHQAYKGAQIAQSHYLKELQARDTTIKELTNKLEAATENYGDALVKIEKLTGLLFEEVYKNAFTYWVRQDCTEDAAKHAAHKTLNEYKEQHGI